MNWENKKGEFTPDETIILSALTMNSSLPNLWIKYKDLVKMCAIKESDFKVSLDSLIYKGLIRLGNQGQGLTVGLEERIDDFKKDKLSEVIKELEEELIKAKSSNDIELIEEIEKIINIKKYEVGER